MILKRYILIFTLALISCAGTNYIQTISEEEGTPSVEACSTELEKAIQGETLGLVDLK